MFSLFIMPERRTFGHFLASSEDKFFWLKRRTCPPKGGRMVSLIQKNVASSISVEKKAICRLSKKIKELRLR